jgi:hypothetical protein
VVRVFLFLGGLHMNSFLWLGGTRGFVSKSGLVWEGRAFRFRLLR